jgi:hypothetical protein
MGFFWNAMRVLTITMGLVFLDAISMFVGLSGFM